MAFNLPLNRFTLFQDIDVDGSPVFIINATIWYQKHCSILWFGFSFRYLAFSKSVMFKPATLPCGHSACRNCYRRLLEIEEQKSKTAVLCPGCRKHFGRESLIVSYAMDRVTGSLEVQCLNKDCGWKGQLGEAEDHNRQCPRQAKISCLLGCNEKLLW